MLLSEAWIDLSVGEKYAVVANCPRALPKLFQPHISTFLMRSHLFGFVFTSQNVTMMRQRKSFQQ